ncbi:MAG TPA: (Fe-S)-binding protein [Tepidisphaeraceae bacterium]|nr:(Fe-S)-binding protein [Tepidisphaeraceae bacterium]
MDEYMQINVALFVTCLTDQFYPQVGIAVTKILEHLGCRVEFPEAQTCCGQPFFNNGFKGEARELAKRHVRIFEGYDYVVTPSGSCCAMVREQFEHLFHGDAEWEQGMKKVVGNTYEFVEFLEKVLNVDLTQLTLPAPRTVTFHYTCHSRSIGMKDEGVKMLRQIGNVEFRALEKTDQCCGFGGTFAIKYPAISEAIVEDKVQCIAATKASTTVVNDAGCAMNIAGMCNRAGVQTRVTHLAELIAEAMGLDVDSW